MLEKAALTHFKDVFFSSSFHEEVVLLIIIIIYKNEIRHQVNLDLCMKSRHYRHYYTRSSICESYSTNEKKKPWMQSAYLVGNNKFYCIYIVLDENYTLRVVVQALITLLLNVYIMKSFIIGFKFPSLIDLQFACIKNTNITFLSCITILGQNICTL